MCEKYFFFVILVKNLKTKNKDKEYCFKDKLSKGLFKKEICEGFDFFFFLLERTKEI